LRWDLPPANGGQTVEVAYAELGSAAPALPGAPYKRVTDRSDQSVVYYRREDVQPVKWAALSSARDGLTQFATREAAERHSVSWHGHDSVFQVAPRGQFLDSTGAEFDFAAARLALIEATEVAS
jgi:hypothetical protein